MKFRTYLGCSLIAATAAGVVWPQTRLDLRSQGRSVDFSVADSTKPSKTGTQLPSVCRTGETFIKTNALPGPEWYLCGPDNEWKNSGAAVRTTANTFTARQTFSTAGATAGIQIAPSALPVNPEPGDLAADANDANKLKFFDGTAWRSFDSRPGNFSAFFSGQSTLFVAGLTHNLGTADVLVQCYDAATPSNVVEPSAISVDPDLYDVTIVFPEAQSGRCVINGGATGGPGADGQGAGMSAQLGDFSARRSSATAVTIGGSCSSVSPCNARFGNRVHTFTHAAVVTLGSPSATGIVYVYVDMSGNLTAGSTMPLSCAGGCTVAAGVTAFPANSVPLYSWTATNGSWDLTGAVDYRAWLSSPALLGGTGMVLAQVGGQTTLAVDGAVVPAYLTGTAVLDFPSIPAGRCSADLTFSMPGAAAGDAVAAGWPGGLESGLTGTMRVSAPGAIAVRLCADGSGAIDPASATFRAMLLRSF